jgi:hypothetical protein
LLLKDTVHDEYLLMVTEIEIPWNKFGAFTAPPGFQGKVVWICTEFSVWPESPRLPKGIFRVYFGDERD